MSARWSATGSQPARSIWDRYTDASPWEYYEHSKDHYLLHPETRALLEKLLKMVRDIGQERTFAYMKFLLGCEKDY